MSDLHAKLEIDQNNVLPGQLLKELSYNGLEDHPDYMRYLQVDKGEAVWFIRPEIMDLWTDKPLISEGFATCYPIIAVKPFLTSADFSL